ncbi:CDP-glycerol glycerophosphotransferase family protein, partial [Priestia megaterium]
MLAKIGYVLKIFIAVLLLPFNKVRLKNKKIILIGGHEGKLFADNSKVLYNYLLKKHSKEYEIYWIINSNSSDMAEIDRYIIRGSIKNYSYYLLATGIFFSHSASDVAPVIHNYKKTSGISFCLSHGILGLKKLKKAKNMKKGMADRADLFASVSKFERNIKINDWSLDEKAVKVTGYPRFDDLINKKQEIDVENIILYMPTWREWYSDLSLDSFKKTDYYKEVMELLSNEDLHRLLEKKDFQLHVYVHFYFHRYVSA